MKPVEDGTTLIINGKWNRYILSVKWLAKNIFKADNIQVEFSLNLDLPPRFTKGEVRIVPTHNRVVFIALKYEESVLESIEQMALRLSDLLPVTPVTGLGINHAFTEANPPSSLLELFSLKDNTLLSDTGIKIETSEIKRKLLLDSQILNLSILHQAGSVTPAVSG